ncbi:MAG: alpha-mannosidase [Clostridia bacterium]|nr:alpha-mannosidase [Clostridia bacterium]
MAHVKVVRRSMRPEEWTDLRFVWLKRGIYEEKVEVTDLTIRDARQITENQYVFEDGEERTLRKGDMYFTPDGTAFIRGKAVIPEHMRGKNVYLTLWTAAEMIVKINGKFVGGLDPNRERILLNPYIDRPELMIEIEAYNRSKPDDERNPESMAIRGCRQVFEGMYLATVRDSVQALVYDYTLLMDIAHSEYFNEDYRTFLFRELSKGLDLVDFDTYEGVDEALRYVEEHIYQNTDFGGSGNVALVGHSHLDLAYYWRRIHAVQKNARTILIQLRLMDRYPWFKYTHTQAYTYETLEKYYPELFAELREKVARGQFEPVGAMYVEPDCNIPCAESLTRQLLYGQHYFRKAFGKTIDNAWLPDVFGNSWIMPQILKKSGVNYFVSNKMSTWNDTNRFPHNNFIWRGIDGSEVYACVPPTHFITWNMPSQIQENWEAYQDKEVGGQTLSMYGYGDGGSGVTEEMLELASRFEKLSVMPKTEIMGGSEFLHRNLEGNKNLSVWDGELYLEMHRGTFTTKSNIKRANRKLEELLRETEIISTLRWLKGEAYPQEQLRSLWKKLLLNQFHDILPGSHIHPVYEDAMADYAQIEKELMEILEGGRDLSDCDILNTLPWNVSVLCGFVQDEKGLACRNGVKGSYTLIGESLDTIHVIDGYDFDEYDDDEYEYGDEDADEEEDEDDTFTVHLLSNGNLHVTGLLVDAVLRPDGSFVSLKNAETRYEEEYVREGGGFNKLHLYADNPGVYDAWDILPNYKDKEIPLTLEKPLHVVRQDELTLELSCTFTTGKSTWEMIIRFFDEHGAVEVEHRVDWHEKHRLMKVNFAPNVLTRYLTCDTSAGYIHRELNKNTTWQQARFEVCHHRWMDMSEVDYGVAIINDGKYGVGLEGNEISLSLLRSTIRPDITSDMGKHCFSYMIFAHEGDHVKAEINRRAIEYNTNFRRSDVYFPDVLKEVLGESGLVLQAMKVSENGEMVVLRLSEQDGRRGRLRFPFRVRILNMLEDVQEEAVDVSYKPFEIITLGISPELLKN